MMNITINTKDLVGVVKKLNVVASKMGNHVDTVIAMDAKKMPKNDSVLYGVTFTCFNGKVQVSANLFAKEAQFDGDSYSVKLSAEFITVVESISRAGEDTTILQSNEATSITVKCGAAAVQLGVKTDGLAPILPDLADQSLLEAFWDVNTDEFRKKLAQVGIAEQEKESQRYAGLNMASEDGVFKLRATDGYLMAEASLSILASQVVRAGGAVMASVGLLKSVLGTVECDVVRIFKTTNHLLIQSKLELWQLPLLESSFPYEAMVTLKKTSRASSVTIGKNDLSVAMGIALSTAHIMDKPVVGIQYADGMIEVSNSMKNATSRISLVDAAGEELKPVWFSSRYVKSLLSVLETENVVLSFADELKLPCLIQGAGDNADDTIWFLFLVNPASFKASEEA